MASAAPERSFPRTEVVKNCPVCGSNETFEMFSSPDLLHGVPGNFSYHRCKGCGSVFQNPMVLKEDLHLCYPKEYTPYCYDPETPNFDFDGAASTSRTALRNAVAKSVWGEPVSGFIGLAGRLLAKSRVLRERAFYGIVMDECIPRSHGDQYALDIGCGAGWMLRRLAKVGWLTEGIEWDEDAAHLAHKRTGTKVWAGDFMEIDLPKGKYKLVILSHVFEHLYHPRLALERFHELLAPGGALVLRLPNCNALDAKLFASDWFCWETPRHLILPSGKALLRLASNSGFVEPILRTNVAKWVWQSSKAYRLGKNPEQEQPDLNFSENARFQAQRVLNTLGFMVGSEMIAVFRKP
jgi:2-polyprenyl-3-methyl-5-hydroxy-6-metoxy-1,4-benzoquinol methylase